MITRKLENTSKSLRGFKKITEKLEMLRSAVGGSGCEVVPEYVACCDLIEGDVAHFCFTVPNPICDQYGCISD